MTSVKYWRLFYFLMVLMHRQIKGLLVQALLKSDENVPWLYIHRHDRPYP